jgi:hypothetical protein
MVVWLAARAALAVDIIALAPPALLLCSSVTSLLLHFSGGHDVKGATV